MKKIILLMVIILIYTTSFALASEKTVEVIVSEANKEITQAWINELSKQEVKVETKSTNPITSQVDCVVIFANKDEAQNLEFLQKNLSEKEQERFIKNSAQSAVIKNDLWKKDQLVLVFIASSKNSLRTALENSRELWTGVLSKYTGIQLSQDAMYGY